MITTIDDIFNEIIKSQTDKRTSLIAIEGHGSGLNEDTEKGNIFVMNIGDTKPVN